MSPFLPSLLDTIQKLLGLSSEKTLSSEHPLLVFVTGYEPMLSKVLADEGLSELEVEVKAHILLRAGRLLLQLQSEDGAAPLTPEEWATKVREHVVKAAKRVEKSRLNLKLMQDIDFPSVIQKAREGDRRAWDILLSNLTNDVRRGLVSFRELSPDDILDIVQETFLSFVRVGVRHIQILDRVSISAYLITSARRLAVRLLRVRNRTPTLSLHDLLKEDDDQATSWPPLRDEGPGPERSAIEAEILNHIRHCLEELSLPHRETVILHYFDDLTEVEVGLILGIANGTVASRLHYAAKKLKRCLENAEIFGWFPEY